MDSLLQVGFSNAAAATALALVAGVASLIWRRRPALVHGLWLLVLLKLLTPPLARVPVPEWMAALPAMPAGAANDRDAPTASGDEVAGLEANDADATEEYAAPAPDRVGAVTPLAESTEVAPPGDTGNASNPVSTGIDVRELLVAAVTLWLVGTATWFSLAGWRLWRFARLLRYAVAAPTSVQDEADRIAAALGMRWCPKVELMPGKLAPMVWAGLGAPRLLLPVDLLSHVDAAGVRTLMAHELAHLRRGDHRVRLVEILAMGLFWWHPVVWIARRSLREAEEQCCDAWVVSALPGTGKTYATALLETLDFLSAAPSAPPLACGIGQVSDLKRRLTMIMRGATPRALCWREGLAVLGLATLLPLLPTLAKADADGGSRLARAERNDDEEQREFHVVRVHLDDASDPANAEVEKAKAELKALEAELKKKVAEVREASLRLRDAAEKIHRVELDKVKGKVKDLTEKTMNEVQEKIIKEIQVQVQPGQHGSRRMIVQGPIEIEITADGQTHFRKVEGGMRMRGSVSGGASTGVSSAAGPGVAVGAGSADATRRPAIPPVPPVPPLAPMPPLPAAAAPAPAPAAQPAPPDGSRRAAAGRRNEGREEERRMDQLERKLDTVMRELEKLRKEKAESSRKKDKKTDKDEDED